MYLAIGIYTDQGFCASRPTTSNNPQEVASYLHKELDTWFDQILLVENDADSPSVIQHWNIDRDYTDK